MNPGQKNFSEDEEDVGERAASREGRERDGCCTRGRSERKEKSLDRDGKVPLTGCECELRAENGALGAGLWGRNIKNS